jgi:hypothetical protein
MSKEQGAELEMEAYLRNYRNAGLLPSNRAYWQSEALDSYYENLKKMHGGFFPIGINSFESKSWHSIYRIPRTY